MERANATLRYGFVKGEGGERLTITAPADVLGWSKRKVGSNHIFSHLRTSDRKQVRLAFNSAVIGGRLNYHGQKRAIADANGLITRLTSLTNEGMLAADTRLQLTQFKPAYEREFAIAATLARPVAEPLRVKRLAAHYMGILATDLRYGNFGGPEAAERDIIHDLNYGPANITLGVAGQSCLMTHVKDGRAEGPIADVSGVAADPRVPLIMLAGLTAISYADELLQHEQAA